MARRILLALLLSVTATACLHADDTVWGTGLVVTTTDGQKLAYPLDDKPKVTFSGRNLVLTTGSTEITLSREKVRAFSYEKIPVSGINAIPETICDARFLPDGTLHVSGCDRDSRIEIFGVDGILLCTMNADSKGNADMSASDLPAGIYLVKAGDVSYKIMKR